MPTVQSGSDSQRCTEARDRQIIESARDFAIISLDLEGRVTSWNNGAERILGWRHDEVVGSPLDRIFTPEDLACGRPSIEMKLAAEQGYSPDERLHLRKNGQLFWASGQMTPLKDETGAVTGFVKILRDETEQRNVQLQLKRLAENLEQEVAQRTKERDRLWRNSLDLLLVLTGDGILHAVNPAWTAKLGYQPEDLEGKYFEPFVHPGDISPTLAAIGQAAERPVVRFENRVRHKYDGSYRWIAWTAAPEEDLIFANGRDITLEKQQADQLLSASQMRLQLALEAGRLVAWEWDAENDALYWSEGLLQLHGIVPATAGVTTSIEHALRMAHPEDRERLKAALQSSLASGADYQVEYRVVWADGSMHWISSIGRPMTDAAGKPVRVVGVKSDITRRKRDEENLRFLARVSAELAQLVDPESALQRLAHLAVPSFADWCVVDLVQDDGSLKTVSAAHVEPEKEALIEELVQRFPPDPRARRGAWAIFRSGKAELITVVTDSILETELKDPAYRALLRQLGVASYIAVPLIAHGKILGVITFMIAVAERPYGEEDLALAEDLGRRAGVAIENASLYRKLQQADRAKDVFLATLAHELRNPLAAGVNGLALLKLSAGDEKKVGSFTAVIERQVGQLVRLVDDLMDISRISTGKIELRKEPVDLAQILHSAIETCRSQVQAGRHRLSIALPPVPTTTVADPVRLAQVFSNLISNAAKYTPPGGEISIGVERGEEEYRVSVKDTGIGIEQNMLTNIFRIFTQVTHPLERNQGGLGIGLALAEGIMKLHGGRVEAFSAGAGKGSEFIVYLPVADHRPEPPLAKKPEQPARPVLPPRRVLVVDDNVDAALTSAEILRMFGSETSVAHDGPGAIATFAQFHPEIVLLDIGLPGLDGYEVARRIRAMPGSDRALLIALTGWGQPQDKQRAREAGFDEHWVKPVELEQFRTLLQRSKDDDVVQFPDSPRSADM